MISIGTSCSHMKKSNKNYINLIKRSIIIIIKNLIMNKYKINYDQGSIFFNTIKKCLLVID